MGRTQRRGGVLDLRTARRTRLSHVRWYRPYGVQERWLIDPRVRKVDVLDFEGTSIDAPHIYRAQDEFRSRVLRDFTMRVVDLYRV